MYPPVGLRKFVLPSWMNVSFSAAVRAAALSPPDEATGAGADVSIVSSNEGISQIAGEHLGRRRGTELHEMPDARTVWQGMEITQR